MQIEIKMSQVNGLSALFYCYQVPGLVIFQYRFLFNTLVNFWYTLVSTCICNVTIWVHSFYKLLLANVIYGYEHKCFTRVQSSLLRETVTSWLFYFSHTLTTETKTHITWGTINNDITTVDIPKTKQVRLQYNKQTQVESLNVDTNNLYTYT